MTGVYRRENITEVAPVPTLTPLGTWPDGNRSRGHFLGGMAAEDQCHADLYGVNDMTFIKTFLRDEAGASAAEYALILAIVGAAIAVAVVALGGAIEQAISQATSAVTTANGL